MRQVDHFIVGKSAAATRKHKAWNPSTGEVQAEVALARYRRRWLKRLRDPHNGVGMTNNVRNTSEMENRT